MELIVVLAIMALLGSILITGVGSLGFGSSRAKSAAIIEGLRQAYATTAVQRGSMPAPAEHPLAASAGSSGAPRPPFVRSTANGGGALDRQSLALVGVELSNLPPAQQTRLLLADDLLAETGTPHLYGMERRLLGVPGAPVEGVTDRKRLPRVDSGQLISAPDDQTLYPDSVYREDAADAGADGSRAALDYLFASSNARSELARLGALVSPASSGDLVAWGRVWSSAGSDGAAGATAWTPGLIRDPARPDFTSGSHSGTPRWIPWDIRGLRIVDAWGTELLVATGQAGGLRIISAGPDRVFRFHPGADGIYQTAPGDAATSGDDVDGAHDNVDAASGGR
jgi:hypothetical protein